MSKPPRGLSRRVTYYASHHTNRRQAEAGADIVMLDNFDPPGLKEAAAQVKARYPHVTIEASGVSECALSSLACPRGGMDRRMMERKDQTLGGGD